MTNPINEEDIDSSELNKRYGYETADKAYYEELRIRADKQKNNPTEAEKALWQLLKGKKLAGYKFRRQHIIGAYIVDFICLDYRIIIELDGGIHRVPENAEQDAIRTQWLEKMGFKVIRFENEQILLDTDSALLSIIENIDAQKYAPAKLAPATSPSGRTGGRRCWSHPHGNSKRRCA
ncbi:MAG: endonuclease domain-containing protein [Bacteroidetes bacterium]|nr:endonuclease domain-containing protein [Bacteroidota bacterium]